MITFFNIKSGEVKEVDTEPTLAAFYNSTDQHVNAHVGQDMGWRLAPETIKRIREIKTDQRLMDRIATTFQLPDDGVSDTDVLRWISLEDARKEAEKTQVSESDHKATYEAQLRALDEPKNDGTKPVESVKIEGEKKDNDNKGK